MTDYRLRNRDLLYAAPGKPPLNWRAIAIFGVIAAVATVGVAGYLAERFNAASSGVTLAQDPAPEPAIQLATPAGSRSGS